MTLPWTETHPYIPSEEGTYRYGFTAMTLCAGDQSVVPSQEGWQCAAVWRTDGVGFRFRHDERHR
jgi:hypothetical protein